MKEEKKLGKRLRQVREERNITVKELSDRTGITQSIIEKLEKGDLIPSLSPLVKIARALGVRLGTFLDDHPNLGPVINRPGTERQALRFSDKEHQSQSDLDFFSLAADKAGRHMEPFLIDVQPTSRNNPALSSHEGEEFIYVVEGEIEIVYGKETFQLTQGNSIYYDSIIPHHVHSGKNEAAKILAVVYAPI